VSQVRHGMSPVGQNPLRRLCETKAAVSRRYVFRGHGRRLMRKLRHPIAIFVIFVLIVIGVGGGFVDGLTRPRVKVSLSMAWWGLSPRHVR